MLLMARGQFRRSCPHLHTARSAVEAYPLPAPAVIISVARVNVMHN